MKKDFRRTPIAAAVLAVFAVPMVHAQADDAQKAAEAAARELELAAAPATELPEVTVEQEPPVPYKADRPSSPKYMGPLRDIPQNVTVIPKQLIEDQNNLSLRQILSNVPGVTFGAGEGGGGYGDSINLRGYSANSDITVDGVRNSAQTTRSDPFNLEQLEIFKGPNSVYAGSGGVSGGINLVSKQAQDENFNKASVGVGTDAYTRATIDSNQKLGDSSALRLNAMVHQNEVAERDYVEFKRWGIAPSLAFGLGTPTQVVISYFHQDDENIPDYGVPFRNFEKVPGVDRSNFYGFRGIDTEEITNDVFTNTVTHRIGEKATVRNLTRYGQTDNLTIASGIQGRVCVTAGQNPLGDPAATTPCANSGVYEPTGGPRGLSRDARTTVLSNQTDFTVEFATGAVTHTLVSGFQFNEEDYQRTGLTSVMDLTQVAATSTDLYNPNFTYNGVISTTPTEEVASDVGSRAIYVFDTLKFSPNWLLSAGLRYEHMDATIEANPPAATPTTTKSSDDFMSGRLGLVYKPVENGSLYVAYGNSANPLSATIISNPRPGNAGNLSPVTDTTDPERTVSYEAGVKWDLLGGKLATTATVFRNEKDKVSVASAIVGQDNVLDGKSRVDGIELGATGEINQRWSLYATYAFLDSEILQSVANGVAVDAQKGHDLALTPRHSGNIWTTYLLPMGLEFGYGLQYVGTSFQAATGDAKVPAFTLHNALIGYKVNQQIYLRLNGSNLANEEYYSRLRGNAIGWADPGVGRTFVLTADYNF